MRKLVIALIITTFLTGCAGPAEKKEPAVSASKLSEVSKRAAATGKTASAEICTNCVMARVEAKPEKAKSCTRVKVYVNKTLERIDEHCTPTKSHAKKAKRTKRSKYHQRSE